MPSSCTSLAKTLLQVASHKVPQVQLLEKLATPRKQTGSSIHSPPRGEEEKGERKWSEPPHAQ